MVVSISVALSLVLSPPSAAAGSETPVPPPLVASPELDASMMIAPSPPFAVMPPRWNGNMLFATGAFTAATGMALHALAAYGVQENCAVARDPSELLPEQARELGIGDVLDSTFLARIDVICSPEVALAGGARTVVPILSAGAIAQIATGGAFRGYAMGYDDAISGRRRSAAAMMGVGSVLMVAGAALWAGSRAAMPNNRTGCDTIDCVVWYDFATLQGSSILFMAGSGLVTQGASYRRSRRHYERWQNIDVRPMVSRSQAGLMLEGRF
jgi:hypothetical protein